MKIMKKIISILLALSILCSVGYAYEIPFYQKVENPTLNLPVPELPKVTDGTVVIEAENCLLSKNTTVISETDASESSSVRFSPAAAATTVDLSDKNYTLKAEFVTDETISLSMWARVRTTTDSNNSVFWAVNSDNFNTKNFTAKDEYQWINLATAAMSPGTSFFALKYREIGFIIDKFIFTEDAGFIPQGANDVPTVAAPGEKSPLLELYPEAPIKPIEGHPRVFLTKDHIAKLKEYVKAPELAPAWETVKQTAAQNLNSELPNKASGNYDANVVNMVQCRALLYVMGEKDEIYAKETVKHARNVLQTVTFPNISDITRQMGTVMTMGAVVYDWCYDHMTDDDKKLFIGKFKQICSLKEIGYPPKESVLNGVGGHMGEYEIHRDMLSAGIACYDEDPEMYELGAGLLFSEFTESRKMFNASGNHPNGSAYGLHRLACELYGDFLMQRMGYPPLYGEDMQKVMLRYIYARRPDGLVMKDSDDYSYSGRNSVTYYHTNDWPSLITLNALYDEPYTRGQFLKLLSRQGYTADSFWLILGADPDKEAKQPDDLPLAYKTTYPLTSIFHRTSWQPGMDSNAVVAQFKAYERHIGDHMHLDAGHFSIYYKGNLAIDAGNYQGKQGGWGDAHAFNYDKRSVSHNVVTVYDPDEKFVYAGKTYANDGGQRMRNDIIAPNYEELLTDTWLYAKTQGTYIGPQEKTPAFSYLKSDLTPAYSDKIKDYSRSMVFIDLFDEDYPAAFVVYDNVTTSDKSFEKNWLLHSIEEPTVDGNTTVIQRTTDGYNGKLVNKTLLPAAFEIEKIGGENKEAFVDGFNYPNEDKKEFDSEQGKWRIELSPKRPSENDVFLNAMYVTDADGNLPELPMHQESMSGMVGVTVKDRTVLFAQNAKVKNSPLSITLRDNGFDTMQCLIADLEAGVWNITNGAGFSINAESKEGEGVIVFSAAPGTYTITKADGAQVTLQSFENRHTEMFGDFILYNRINGCYLRCEKPNKEIDGIAYVPAKTFFKQLGAGVVWDAAKGCAVATRGEHSIELYNGVTSYVLKGKEYKLSAPVKVFDGVMYVPALDFKAFLSCSMTYDKVAKILSLSVTDPSPEIIALVDVANDVYEPAVISASGNDGNIPENANDYSLTTRWSCEGTDTWIQYDLGEVCTIGSVMMAFHSGDKRQTYVDIEFSTDGVNYTKVYAGASSGTSTLLETFPASGSARYVRVRGHGNSINLWNSITELIVTK